MEAHELYSCLKQDYAFQDLSTAKQQDFTNKIKNIQERGYEIAKSQLSPGVIDIAIPIGITGTDLSGTLAVSQLGSEVKSPNIQTNLKAMRACAKDIHKNLGI